MLNTKISVIGTFVRDEIYPWNSTPVNSIGGIYYTIAYLANLAGNENEIWPVCVVGDDFYPLVIHELKRFKNVRTDCIKKIDRVNTRVELHYTSATERDETTTEPMPALQTENLDQILDSDLTIVNLITGSDLELEAIKNLSANSKCTIYLDIHSRTLGIAPDGKRYLRKPDDWIDWFSHADIVQMNEDEAYLLSSTPHGRKHLVEFGKKVLDVNPSICHITLAEKGSYLFYKKSESHEFLKIRAQDLQDMVDVVGCGDAFEAAFSLHYLKNHDVVAATKFANKIARENCRFYGSSGISRIKKYMIN